MLIIYMNDELSDEWSDDDDDDDVIQIKILNTHIITSVVTPIVDPIEKNHIFLIVEQLFTDEISLYLNEYIMSTSICFNVQHKEDLIALGDRIQKVIPYNLLGNYDLYLTLIFIYHSLLDEPGEDIFTGFFNRYAYNYKLVTELYFKLTTGELIEDNGNDLSQDARRKILGFV